MNEKNSGNTSSSKKLIIIMIAAVIVVIGIICGIFAVSNTKSEKIQNNTEPDISKVAVESITFKDTSVTVEVGEKINLYQMVESIDCANEDILYTCDDTSVAKIDENGVLTALAEGDTVITAQLKSNNTVTAMLSVMVTASDDTDTQTDTKTSETDSIVSSDPDVKNSTSSSVSSKSVSSVTSKSDNTSSNSVSSATVSANTVTSQADNTNNNNDNNNDNTVNDQSEEEYYYEENSTPENNNDTEENTPVYDDSNNDTDNNDTYEYIDPYSVGKVYPISYVETDEKKVGISFDASWGNENTQSILDTLESYNITSTFFLVGIWVRAYPEDVVRIAQAGHDIGNHSNTHPDLTQLDSWSIRNEMEVCSAEIEALTGKRPTLFRNPYGAYDNRVIGTALGMGMDCIQWDVDTLDWTNNSGEEICARIRSRIRNGSIILMHNAGGNTASSLPMIIDTIHELGYEIVPISELIPEGGYTTDITGKLTPLAPPEDVQSSAVSSAFKKIRQK